MKVAIVYASLHHGNTKKVVDVLAKELDADIYSTHELAGVDIESYDVIGLASGIFYGKMHAGITNLIRIYEFKKHQKFFLVATCGMRYKNYLKPFELTLQDKHFEVVDTFMCPGYDTFGPLAKIGGIRKGRPNAKDLMKAKEFAANLRKKLAQTEAN